MGLKPLADRVVLKAVEEEAITKSGIVLPDSAKEKPQQGEIIATGPGKRDEDGEFIKMEVKTGDRVIYRKYGGTEIKQDGEEFLIVGEDDILAIVE